MMNSIAPIWDGNETWLVLGSVGLLAAFPLAFAIIIPAVYFPIAIMLLALVFRGVAFEFRYRDAEHKSSGTMDFSRARRSRLSLRASFLALLSRASRSRPSFCRQLLRLLHAVFAVDGLGARVGLRPARRRWLVLKTEGDIQVRARRHGRSLSSASSSLLPPSAYGPHSPTPDIARRWFSWPNLIFLSPVPVVTAVIAFFVWRSLNRQSEQVPSSARSGFS